MNRFLIRFFEQGFPGIEAGTDALIGGERYIRIPDRIVYYSGNRYSINHFAQVREEIYPDPLGQSRKSKAKMYLPYYAMKADPAYRKLLTMEPAVGDRRRTAFTIALFYYALNVNYETASESLLGWYERLNDTSDFTWKEVERGLKSAYSGEYGGPHHSWVFKLTGIKPTVYFTRRKSEEERLNSTSEQWKARFLELLRTQGGEMSISNRQLCELLGLSSRAMLEHVVGQLIEEGTIVKQIEGKGRCATTIYRIVRHEPVDPLNKNVVPFPPGRAAKKSRGNVVFAMTQNRIEIQSVLGSGGGSPGSVDSSTGPPSG
jgi:biotin operon repressor